MNTRSRKVSNNVHEKQKQALFGFQGKSKIIKKQKVTKQRNSLKDTKIFLDKAENLQQKSKITEKTKPQFINEQFSDQPTYDIFLKRTLERIKAVKQYQQANRIPRSFVKSRSMCVYYEYFHGKQHITEFYPTLSSEFIGYKQIKDKKISNQLRFSLNCPIVRVPTDIAVKQLDQCKKNGTLEKKLKFL